MAAHGRGADEACTCIDTQLKVPQSKC